MIKRFYVLFAILLSLNVCVPHIMYAQEGEVGEGGEDQIGAAEAPEAIVIRDTNLSAAIRSTLGLAEDATLTATDMLNLMSLEAKEAGITDLSGLEHATHLTTLNLYSNQLTDLSPLSGLEGLLSLDLGKNTITDIESLKGLTGLTDLHLDGNPLTDFGPLSSLTGLSVLHLSRTGISDLSVLENLTTLTQLYLTGNEISDISVLSGLTEMGWLFLAQNEISDVSPLVGMEALVSLRLLGNPVSNPSVLYGLTQGNLIDVDIEIPAPSFVSVCDRTPQVRDAIVAAVSGVSDCADVTAADLASITSLYLGSQDITALKANDFNGLTALEFLDLWGNDLSNLPDGLFDDLTKLKYLYLYNNDLSRLPDDLFDDPTELKTLFLFNNDLNSLPDGLFDDLTALEWINMDNNDLSRLPDGLFDDLTALKYLNLRYNKLSSLSSDVFDGPIALELLDLGYNSLRSLPAGLFDGLTKLKQLVLASNPVYPLPVTVSLEKVGEGELKATAHTGAPFDIVLHLVVTNGSIDGGGTPRLTISTGTMESETVTVARTPGTADAVWVDIGTLPGPPQTTHSGYELVKSEDLPLTVIEPPGVSIAVPSDPQKGAFDVVITFTERVSGFEQADVTLSGTSTASITAWATTDDTVFTATITPTTSGDVVVSVMADVATDAAGNNNTASDAVTVTVDMMPPGVRISVPAGVQNTAFDVVITFTERVSDFEQSDLSLSGTSTASITAWATTDDTVFTAIITPTTSGTLTLRIAEGAVTDTAGNTNVLSTAEVNITIASVSVSVCDRTPQVRDAIVAAVSGVSDCADVTAADLASITSLHLSSQNITALTANDFNGLTALENLYLDNNGLSRLPEGLFDDLTALENLYLDNNDLSRLPEGLFDDLTALENLYLDNNDLSRLPEGLFDDLTALENLYLDNNGLSRLPEGLFDDLTALERLVLESNGLRSLPEGIFEKLTALKELRLTKNNLDSLPEGIFDDLTVLKKFYLDYNKLRSLPDGIFEKLTALEVLELDFNNLRSLPEGIFDDLTALKELRLSRNSLSRLPDGLFDDFTKLEYLYLHNNDLDSLPDGIFDDLTALEMLYLSENDLSRLPDGLFDGLTALRWLFLSGNAVNPLSVIVSLKKVGEGQLKATAHTGAPFDIVLPLVVTNGSIEDGGAPSLTISTGTVESETVTVARTPGTVDAVSVDIGTLPGLPGPSTHSGYALVKSEDLPLTVIEGLGAAAPGIAAEVVLPDETTLSANYPNPFNPETWIPYQLANPSEVVISIYDARGRVVRRLVLGHQPAGYYTRRSRAAYWDGRNDFGERVASGFYFYQLKTDTVSVLRKMVILK